MIKHLTCKSEFKDRLKVRFFPLFCESLVDYDYRNDGLYVQVPFAGTQIYGNPSDLLNKPKCQAEIFCTICQKYLPIKEFEFYMACVLCGKKSDKVAKIHCRKSRPSVLFGCVECIKNNCVKICGRQRGLCDAWRETIYRHQSLREVTNG